MLYSIEVRIHSRLQSKDSMKLSRNKEKGLVIQCCGGFFGVFFFFLCLEEPKNKSRCEHQEQQCLPWISVLDKKVFRTPFSTETGSESQKRQRTSYPTWYLTVLINAAHEVQCFCFSWCPKNEEFDLWFSCCHQQLLCFWYHREVTLRPWVWETWGNQHLQHGAAFGTYVLNTYMLKD